MTPLIYAFCCIFLFCMSFVFCSFFPGFLCIITLSFSICLSGVILRSWLQWPSSAQQNRNKPQHNKISTIQRKQLQRDKISTTETSCNTMETSHNTTKLVLCVVLRMILLCYEDFVVWCTTGPPYLASLYMTQKLNVCSMLYSAVSH